MSLRHFAAALLTAALVMASAPAAHAAPWTINPDPTPTSEVGKKLTLTGTVVGANRKYVTLYKRHASQSTYKKVKTSRTTSSGRYRFTVVPAKAGRNHYRIKVSKSGSKRAASRTLASITFRWRDLSGLPFTTVGSVIKEPVASTSSISFTRSISIGHTSSARWDLAGLGCQDLRTYAGLLDGGLGIAGYGAISDPTIPAVFFESSTLGRTAAHFPFYVQRRLMASTDLEFYAEIVSGDPTDARVLFGSPQVRCSS